MGLRHQNVSASCHSSIFKIYAKIMNILHQWIFLGLYTVMITSSNGICEFPAQRPVTRSFHVFFDLRLNKQLSKQSWGWWFETQSRPLWLHCNGSYLLRCIKMYPHARGYLITVGKANYYIHIKNFIWGGPTNSFRLSNNTLWRQRFWSSSV